LYGQVFLGHWKDWDFTKNDVKIPSYGLQIGSRIASAFFLAFRAGSAGYTLVRSRGEQNPVFGKWKGIHGAFIFGVFEKNKKMRYSELNFILEGYALKPKDTAAIATFDSTRQRLVFEILLSYSYSIDEVERNLADSKLFYNIIK
jgi:hypothetical protein